MQRRTRNIRIKDPAAAAIYSMKKYHASIMKYLDTDDWEDIRQIGRLNHLLYGENTLEVLRGVGRDIQRFLRAKGFSWTTRGAKYKNGMQIKKGKFMVLRRMTPVDPVKLLSMSPDLRKSLTVRSIVYESS